MKENSGMFQFEWQPLALAAERFLAAIFQEESPECGAGEAFFEEVNVFEKAIEGFQGHELSSLEREAVFWLGRAIRDAQHKGRFDLFMMALGQFTYMASRLARIQRMEA